MSAGRVLRALLVLAALLQLWQAVRITRYDAAFRGGVRAYRDARPQQALASMQAARRIWPADPDTSIWVGDTAAYVYDSAARPWEVATGGRVLRQAWSGYAGAVLRAPADSWSWSGLCETALRWARLRDRAVGVDLQRFERQGSGVLDPARAAALAAGRLAVQLKPAGFQELDVLGEAYQAVGAHDRAMEVFVRSARMLPAPSYHTWGDGRVLLAEVYRALLTGLEAGIARAPSFAHSAMQLDIGLFARAQGDLDTAALMLAAAERSAQSEYDLFQARQYLGSVQEERGRYAEAAEVWKRALPMGHHVEMLHRRLGTAELLLGRYADACRSLRTALASAPEEGLRLNAATACVQAGEEEVAEEILRSGLTSPVEQQELALRLVEHLRAHGRRNAARNQVQMWAREHPQSEMIQAWVRESEGW